MAEYVPMSARSTTPPTPAVGPIPQGQFKYVPMSDRVSSPTTQGTFNYLPVSQRSGADPVEPSYFYGTTPKGGTIGRSDQLDTSGRPLFAYRNAGDTSTTTDKTRTATTFDPRVAQPLTHEQYYNPRADNLRQTFHDELNIQPSQELDHAIALTVGGSNQRENLRAIPTAENQEAGKFELSLAEQLKAGKISYFDAQTLDAKHKGIPTPWVGDQQNKLLDTILSGIKVGAEKVKTSVNTYLDQKQKVDNQFIPNVIQGITHPADTVKKAYDELTAPFIQSIKQTAGGIGQVVSGDRIHPIASRISGGLNLMSGTLNALFSSAIPVNQAFKLAENIPTLKPFADIAGIPPTLGGVATSFTTGKAIDWIPDRFISPEAKAIIKEPAKEFSNIVGQIVIGGLIMDMISKYIKDGSQVTPEAANQIVDKAKEIAVDSQPSLFSESEKSEMAQRFDTSSEVSQGIDGSIKTLEQMAKDPEIAKRLFVGDSNVLNPQSASGQINDIAAKLDIYKKGLGETFKSSLDSNNLTLDSIKQNALNTLDIASTKSNWSPTMNSEEAIDFSKDSKLQGTFYHGIDEAGATKIKEGGFTPSKEFPSSGAISLTDSPDIAKTYGNEILPVKVNVQNVKVFPDVKTYTDALEGTAGETSGIKESSLLSQYDAVVVKNGLGVGKDMVMVPNPKNLTVVTSSETTSLPPIALTDIAKEVEPKPKGLPNTQAGMVDPSAIAKSVESTIKSTKDFIDESKKQTEYTGNLQDDFYRLKNREEIDRIASLKLAEEVKGTPKDYEAIYHYIEDKNFPITDRQRALYDSEIKPIESEISKLYSKLKNDGVPVENTDHIHRIIADRGGPIERIQAGLKSITGGLLRKTASSLKERVMKKIVDESGNEKIVSIKNGEVTAWNDQKPTPLGKERLPTMPKIREFYDENVMTALEKLARDLGIKHERVFKGKDMGGQRAGVSYQGENKIKTKFATPERVLMHEIGHQIDHKYGLQSLVGSHADALQLIKDPRFRKELRSLADLRAEGHEVTPGRRSYLRSNGEKMAAMFEAYLHTPEKFKEVAPNLYLQFTQFLASHEELKPLLNLKRSLVLGSRTMGGPEPSNVFIDKNGKRWAIKDATTREIEGATNIKYHKNALASELIEYNELKKVDRATEYLEALKNDPEFMRLAVKEGTMNPPKGYRATNLPQLRGYLFPERVAEVFDDFYKQRSTDGVAETYRKINSVLRTSIFFNPFIHIPNIINHWAVNRGLLDTVNPLTYSRLVRTGIKAIQATLTLNKDYTDVLDKGGSLMYSKTETSNLPKLLLDKMGLELDSNKTLLGRISKDLGVLNPARIVKAIYDFSGKATWASNDIATLQAVFEEMEKGISMEKAIEDVSKHIPNYRVPSRVLGSRAIASMMKGDSAITMFGAYHYGALKSYGELIKSIEQGVRGKVSSKETVSAVDKIIALALITYFVYPQLDKIAKWASGNKKAQFRRAGASTFINNTQEFIKSTEQRGKLSSTDLSQYLQSVVTPAPLLKTGAEIGTGRDSFTGSPIDYNLQYLGKQLSPVSYGQRIASGELLPKNFALSLIGISSPKTTPSEQVVNSLIYDERTKVDNQVKELYSQGKNTEGTKLLSDFNRKLVNTSNDAIAEAGYKKLSPTDMANRLKAHLIRIPTVQVIQNYRAKQKPGSSFDKMITK